MAVKNSIENVAIFGEFYPKFNRKKASLTIWYVLDFINLKTVELVRCCADSISLILYEFGFFLFASVSSYIGSGNAPLFMYDVPWPVCVCVCANSI